jgi:hypothetical protein
VADAAQSLPLHHIKHGTGDGVQLQATGEKRNDMSNFSREELELFVGDWYRALDVHEPMVNFISMLAAEGLEMQFPEATLHGIAQFEGWYQGVIRIFFDEVHIVRDVKVQRSGDEYNLDVVVHWEASMWKPPAARSERIMLDAYQHWVVVASPDTGRPTIRTYIVDRLDYRKGSATL